MRIESVRMKTDIEKCKFFQRLMSNPITTKILGETHKEMKGRYNKKGKWSNFLTELMDICRRNETKDELIIPYFLFNKKNQDYIEELPELGKIRQLVRIIQKNLRTEKMNGFRSGTADTIRYLLTKIHAGNDQESKELLELIAEAFKKKEEENEDL